MSKRLDLVGQRFGRLSVLRFSHTNERGASVWVCQCDCRNEAHVEGYLLKRGNTRSCGCLQKEAAANVVVKRCTKHGMCKTRLHRIWTHMKERCNNQNCKSFPDYGGRGIKVCDSWSEDFLMFHEWAMANGYEDNLSIDRINANGNYEPSNCRWATDYQQANNKRKNAFITFNGETHTMSEWASITGINYNTLRARRSRGCKPEQILAKEGVSGGFSL